MRQTLARWRTGIRTRVLDAWWLVREGPRAAFRRSIVGSVLVATLVVVIAFDVVLLVRALGNPPGSTVPAGIPTGIVSITDIDDLSPADEILPEPPTQPHVVADEDRDDRTADEGRKDDRERPPDRSSSAEGSATPTTAPPDTDTAPATNDATDQRPEPSPTDAADTGGGSGPGGGGPDTGGGDSGDDGGGGGGGGGG